MTDTPRYNPAIHHRRSIRLQGYDYSQAGAYFITICTHNRECLFGEIADDKMNTNDAGNMAAKCWNAIPEHFPQVKLDQFVVMPNHVHGVLTIVDSRAGVGAKDFSPLQPFGTSRTIGSIIRGFKIGVTKWVRQYTAIYDVWQRNYWEHIVRNETELNRIREYILNNSAQWKLDKLHPCKGEKFFAPTKTHEPTVGYGLEDWMV